MKKFKNSLSKSIATLNLKKTNYIEETKCRTYISTLESKILNLKLTVGEKFYKAFINDNFNIGDFIPIFEEISTKYEEIENQKSKIDELIRTEKAILGTEDNEDVVYCVECGTKNSSHYLYCISCVSQLIK